MTVYAVTQENWNDPTFWAAISESSAGHQLDLAGLPDGVEAEFDQANLVLFLHYEGGSFLIGDTTAPAVFDAQLGAGTDWSYFTLLTGSAGDDKLGGGEGDDTLWGAAGEDSILGYAGDDLIYGGDGGDTVHAGIGADTVIGGGGDDSLSGNEGNDWLEGGAGSDSLYGQEGDDYVSGGDGDDTLEGNEGADTIVGGAGNDWMRGSYGNDALWGGTGDDSYWGGWGDDTFHIENGFGNDTVDAEGVDEVLGDTLDLSLVTDALRLDLGDINPENGRVSDGTSTLIYDEVEHIILGAGEDTLALSNGGGHDAVQGFAPPSALGDGTYAGNDLLDVSGLTDAEGNPLDIGDVAVSDTVGDGTGDAVLSFPGGASLTLVGVLASEVSSAAQLQAMGIPAASEETDPVEPGDPVDPVDPIDPVDPVETTGELPQIDGAFEFEATVRFDDLSAAPGQKVFEFGGAGEDRLSFGQLGPSTAVLFEIVQDGASWLIVAEDAIVEGESATWTVGVDETGFMYVEKDGLQIAEGDGVVPADSERLTNMLGGSDGTALVGAISGVSVTQASGTWVSDGGSGADAGGDGGGTGGDTGGEIGGETGGSTDPTDPDPADPTDPTGPDPDSDVIPQIGGAFEFEASLRFDDITGARDQRVFEFGGAGEDRITFGQLGPSSAVLFEIVQDGVTALIVAEDAISEGETATWTVGVDETGFMYIEKDGVQIAEGDGIVPADSDRLENLLGGSGSTTLQGEMSDVSLVQGSEIWTPEEGTQVYDPGETDAEDGGGAADPVLPEPTDDDLPQIGGAFEFEAELRFDDLTDARGQQVFEFGGSGEDRIAFGQLGPSDAVVFSVSQGGYTHYIVAEDALTEGETASWTVGVDETGLMYVEKDGVQIAEGEGVVPNGSARFSNLLGGSGDSALQGQMSDVSVTQEGSHWWLDEAGEAHLELHGTEEDELLEGGSGDDTLWGGGGDDTLTGGDGADDFGVSAAAGNVTITDFSGADRIDLSQLGQWADGEALMAALSQADGTASLSFDIDGAAQTLLIHADEELTEDDFLL